MIPWHHVRLKEFAVWSWDYHKTAPRDQGGVHGTARSEQPLGQWTVWPVDFPCDPTNENASFNLNQVLECHFQADFRERACQSRALLPKPDVQGIFITRQGEANSCRCRPDTTAGFAGLHKGDMHWLCLIRAGRMGWDPLLFDGEHCYEDRQSLCSLSETIV